MTVHTILVRNNIFIVPIVKNFYVFTNRAISKQALHFLPMCARVGAVRLKEKIRLGWSRV